MFDVVPIWNSLFTVLAVLFVLWKIDIYKFLGYDVYFDVFFSLLLAWFYMGTYAGATVGIISGLMLGIILRVTRWLIGYERFSIRQRRWVYHPR